MSRGSNELNELTWARVTSGAAFSTTVIVAAKAGYKVKAFSVIYATLADNAIFFETGTTAIGPRIEALAKTTGQIDCEFETTVGAGLTADSSATTTLTVYVGYKYIKETGNN